MAGPGGHAFAASIPAIVPTASATGYRHRESGALTNVGTNGYAWSSSSSYAGSNNASNLNFNSSNVYPLNNNNRANGFPVRCVQHLPRAVFFFRRFPGGGAGPATIKNSISDPE